MNSNIWIFNQYAITPDMPGGTRHYELSKRLVEKGCNVTIFASSFHYQKFADSKLSENEKYKIEVKDNVAFIWIKSFPYKKNNWKRIVNMLTYSLRAYKLSQILLKREKINLPDVVVGSSVHLFSVLVAYFISKKLKVKFIMEVRDLWPATLIEFKKILKYHPLITFLSLLEKFLVNRADILITVLPNVHLYYSKFNIEEKNIIWIPNGVHTDVFKAETKKKEEFTIMYAGIFGLEGNLETLIQAAKILKQQQNGIKFILLGSGERKKLLLELVEKYELQNVEFRNPVGKEKMPAMLAGADVFWLGTRKVKNLYKYGFSFNKLFEYLAAGRPIIFSIDSEYNPVKEADAGLTIPPEDARALSDAITTLFLMPKNELRQLGENGRKYARKYYDWDILSQKLYDLIQNL